MFIFIVKMYSQVLQARFIYCYPFKYNWPKKLVILDIIPNTTKHTRAKIYTINTHTRNYNMHVILSQTHPPGLTAYIWRIR